MNKAFSEAEDLITEIADALDDMELVNTEVVLCPPTLYIEMASDVAEEANFKVGAQNIYPADAGAFTGEISPLMLKELKVEYCIIGHSERRKYFKESNEFLMAKVDSLLKHGIRPIFCCGEVLPEREAAQHFAVVKKQLEESLFHLTASAFGMVVIAYEPVWVLPLPTNRHRRCMVTSGSWLLKNMEPKPLKIPRSSMAAAVMEKMQWNSLPSLMLTAA